MAQRVRFPGDASGRAPHHTWARWSSFLRLALQGGHVRCGRCGSGAVRRRWSPTPTWSHAFGLDPCRCDACGSTFRVPRRALTAEADEAADAAPLLLPPPPEVDLAALDRDFAVRLGRRSE